MSEERTKTPPAEGDTFGPEPIGQYIYLTVNFNGNCSRQDIIYFIHRNVVNLYLVYELNTCSKDLNTDFALCNCLFGAVKLTENTAKYESSGYGVGFDVDSRFSWSDGEWGKNVLS